MRVANLYKCMY